MLSRHLLMLIAKLHFDRSGQIYLFLEQGLSKSERDSGAGRGVFMGATGHLSDTKIGTIERYERDGKG